MSQEKLVTAIVLKKQILGEIDELVTVYSKEAGKLRALAVSAKLPRSRLQPHLQPLNIVKLRLVGRALPKIAGVELIQSHPLLWEQPEKLQALWVVIELLLRSTADEEANEGVFQSAEAVLDSLLNQDTILALCKFKVELLRALGWLPPYPVNGENIFIFKEGRFKSIGAGTLLSPESIRTYQSLHERTGGDLPGESFEELNFLMQDFIEYQLERKLNAEKLRQKLV